MDKLGAMRALLAVVDQGSFVAAANTLGESKTRLSRQVAALETSLGVRLMQRTTRRLALTEAGTLYVARCRELLQALDEAEEEVASRNQAPRGRLRISAPLTFGAHHLAPLWAEYATLHPAVALEIDLTDRKVDLIEEGLDLAIRITAHTPDSQLVVRRLGASRVVLCASPDYLARHGEPTTPADIARHAVIDYSYASERQTWRLQRDGASEQVRFGSTLVANNGEVCRSFALAGLGLIRQPDFIVGDDLACGRLRAVLPQWQAGEVGIFALYASRKHLPAKVRSMVDFLQQRLTPCPGPACGGA